MNAPSPPVQFPGQPSNALWEFVCWAYREPGVEKACLALQGKHNVDVNILLFCLWLAHVGVGSSMLARYLGAALKLSRDWQRDFVAPLRGVREAMKDMIENTDMVGDVAGSGRAAAAELRARVKACELDMERLQIQALFALVRDAEPRQRSPAEQKDDANNNLTVYFSATGVKLDPLAQAQVMRILTAVFGA